MSLAFEVPGAVTTTGHMITRIDIPIDDIPLLGTEDPDTAMGPDEPKETPMQAQQIQEGAYDPYDHQNLYHSKTSDNVTNIKRNNPNEDDSLLQTGTDREEPNLFKDDVTDFEHYVPSSVINYYSETAISSKKRNKLPDEAFGVPRLRAYPLHDKAHVKQAVRMFGHCKDPKDRETLAKNIFKAMETHNVSMKIGKSNPLYQYAPKSLHETNELPPLTIGGDVPMRKRTRDDVIKEHLRVNGSYYNNIFYGEDYRKSITALKQFKFMEYFHPNVTRMNFVTRLKCVCGGLASPDHADQIYTELKLRNPTDLDFNKPLGWYEVHSEDDVESVAGMLMKSNYDAESNWFKVDLSDDLNHMFYCLRLYSIMGEIFLDPNFDPDLYLSAEHSAVLMDWPQHVYYHYQLYTDADTETEKMRQRQYLLDLFWLFTDNPADQSVDTVNIIAMLHNMACVRDQVINMNEANVPDDLITKDQCSGYLVHDLGLGDDIYLLPTTMQFPIIDKNSVRLAMDMIQQIPDDQRDEYVTNLNRKYKEYGCNFSISVDHPYAKYADKNIIIHMTHMLLEGDTAVDDEGTSTGLTDKMEQPFYKRIDYMKGNLHKNLAQVRELDPNEKPKAEPNHEWQTGSL
ncbi:MAG: hypothetical protein NC489_08355 [Ruminococcus flavefaciens]|nr:hypothetical protein [Ruminococcus flavefaciens]